MALSQVMGSGPSSLPALRPWAGGFANLSLGFPKGNLGIRPHVRKGLAGEVRGGAPERALAPTVRTCSSFTAPPRPPCCMVVPPSAQHPP